MGLGKTVQMIARICERKQNASELKAGYGGTLYVLIILRRSIRLTTQGGSSAGCDGAVGN